MIGDNPATDIAGAEAVGMHGLLVTRGPEQFFRTLVRSLKIV
jgi:ribonucleotide monophosphatase NagD (HAD superfamily)